MRKLDRKHVNQFLLAAMPKLYSVNGDYIKKREEAVGHQKIVCIDFLPSTLAHGRA